MALSNSLLLVLIIFSFYGLYTNKFYFLKVDNYIFPLLAIIHFAYLQGIQSRINSRELSDTSLRNLEYAMYAILPVYIFKLIDTSNIMLSYWEYENYLKPDTFIPVGMGILFSQIVLVLLTIMTFHFRRQILGRYNFDQINDKLDSWQ